MAWLCFVLSFVGVFLKVQERRRWALFSLFFFLNLLAGAVVISRLQQVGNKWYFVYLLSVELLLRASPGCIAHPNSLSFTEQRQNLSELVTLF